jgi:histidine triad (HIT) family protein
MTDCLFCKIRDGIIPAKLVYEDDRAIAFKDINPQAPLHALVVTRKHIPTLLDLTPDDEALVGHMHLIAVKLAREAGHSDDGFRVLFNCNRAAGQTVWHLHLHVLAGRTLGWPPG